MTPDPLQSFNLVPVIATGAILTIKATLVLGVAALVVQTVRRSSAAARHFAWTLSLLSLLVLPALMLLPRWHLVLPLPQALRPARSARLLPGEGSDRWRVMPQPLPIEPTEVIEPTPGDASAPALAGRRSRQSPPPTAYTSPDRVLAGLDRFAAKLASTTWRPAFGTALLTVWAAGMLLLAARLVHGMWRCRDLVRRGRPLPLDAEVGAVGCSLGLRRPVRLVASGDVAVPMTCGSVHPVVIVPADFPRWSAERRRLVLLHELAHVRRLDCLSQTMAQVARALYWFHPLVWRAETQLRRQAEQAADDLVLGTGARASDYAAHLVDIIRSLSSGRPAAVATVSMAGTPLEERVSAILEPNRRRSPMSRLVRLSALALIASGVTLLGTMHVSARIAEASSVPPTPAVEVVSAADSHTFGQIDTKRIEALHEELAAKLAEASAVMIAGNRHHRVHVESGRPVVWDVDCDHDDDCDDDCDHDQGDDDSAVAPTSGSGWYKRAFNLYHGDDFAGCAEAFGKAAELGHARATATYNRACCHALAGDVDAGLRSLEQAIEAGFDSDLILSDSDLTSLRQDGRYREIADRFRALLEDQGRRDPLQKATAELEYLRKHDSDDGDEWYDTAMQLHRLGEYDQAIASWDRSLALGEKTDASTYNIACALARKGDVAAALDRLEEAVERGWSSTDWMEEDDDLDSLRTDPRYQEILRTAKILELPSVSWNDEEQREFLKPAWQAASGRYQQYLDSHPKSGRAWFNLGLAALMSDQPARAAEAFHQAFDLDHRPATTAYNLACSYARGGDKARAFEWLDKALAYQDGGLAWQAADDPDLESLRGDPRFPDLNEFDHGVAKKIRRAMEKVKRKLHSY